MQNSTLTESSEIARRRRIYDRLSQEIDRDLVSGSSFFGNDIRASARERQRARRPESSIPRNDLRRMNNYLSTHTLDLSSSSRTEVTIGQNSREARYRPRSTQNSVPQAPVVYSTHPIQDSWSIRAMPNPAGSQSGFGSPRIKYK